MPPADTAKIPCPTPQHLQVELSALSDVIALGEREETWDKIERAIIRFTAVTRGGGYKHHDMFMKAVGNKGIGLDLVDCMASDRGRLSGAATDLLQTFAPRLGVAFQPLVQLYVAQLVKLLGRPNKVYLKRAERCMSTIISNCPLPAIIPHLRIGLDDRSETCKRLSATSIELAIREWDVDRWHDKDLEVLERCIRKMATDKDAQVRKTGKGVWASFQEIWPERVDDFTGPLTPTTRRYLELPPAEGGPSRIKPVARPAALGRTGGLGPSHPSQPPLHHASSASRLNSSTGSDRGARPTRSQVSALAAPVHRTRIPSEQVETRTASDSSRLRGASAMDPIPRPDQARLTRSGSRVLSHASSSSSLGSSANAAGTGKAAALSAKPTRPTLQPSMSEPTSRRFAPPHRPARPAERPAAVEDEPLRVSAATRSGSAQSYHSASSAGSSRLPPSRRLATNPTSAPPTASNDLPYPPGPSAITPVPRSASHPSLPPVETVPAGPATDASRSASRVRERITHIEKLESASGTTPKRPTPTRELQLAAGIPLPQDTPVSAKQHSQFNQYSLFNQDSPSLSMLLGKHKLPADLDCTLADLSVDVHTADSPLAQRVSGLPEPGPSSAPPSLNGIQGLPGSGSPPSDSAPTGSTPTGLPSAGMSRSSSISQLINKFSPGTGTPLRASLLPVATTPTNAPVALPDERYISPLPKRATEEATPVASTITPRSSKKRKGSEPEPANLVPQPQPQPRPSLIDATPTPAPPFFDAAAPRFMDPTPIRPRARDPQPLISFFDSPAGAPPFRFGTVPSRPRNSIFSALLGLDMDAPAVSTVAPECVQEDEEGDQTIRIGAPADLLVETPDEGVMELTDDDAGDGDVTAIFKPTPEVVPEAILEVAAPEEHVDFAPEPIVTQQAEPVEPEVPVESAARVEETEATVEDEPEIVARPPSPLPPDAVAPPTPLPEVLAEFDALAEREPAVEVEDEGHVPAPTEPQPLIEAEPLIETSLAKDASPEPLVDTSDPIIEDVPEEKRSPLEEMKEVFEEPVADLLKISTGSTVWVTEAKPEPEPEPTSAPAHAATTTTTAAAPRSRPASAAERRPKSVSAAATRRREPVEKKSFRPVSRMQEGKAAPAPARLARSVTAPTAASAARSGAGAPGAAAGASATAAASTSTSTAPPKPVRQARAPQLVTAAKPAPPRPASVSATLSKATGSSLFKPTAATAARAAATAAAASDAKEKDKEKEQDTKAKPASRPPSRPVSSLGQARPASALNQARPPPAAKPVTSTAFTAPPAPAPTATTTRPARSAMGSTAASRAREAALPPIKRQRLKLTAPQESFRPGRTGNKSKASVLGAGSAAPGAASRRARAVRTKKEVETFPLPGPGLRASLGAESEGKEQEGKMEGKGESGKGSETVSVVANEAGKVEGKELRMAGKGQSDKSVPVAMPAKQHLDVPSDLDLVHTPRTPSALFTPDDTNKCLSPASSRHTSYTSYTSHSDFSINSRPSPSKLLQMAAPRALDPVLTPTHSANVSAATSAGQIALVAPVADSPAVVHARRVSGVPASLQKTINDEALARRRSQQQLSSLSSSPPSTGSRTMLSGLGLGIVSEDEDNYTATPRRRTRSQRRAARGSVRQLAEDDDEDASLIAIRHDVSTPTGKASSLLRRLDDERRVLTPRDANERVGVSE